MSSRTKLDFASLLAKKTLFVVIDKIIFRRYNINITSEQDENLVICIGMCGTLYRLCIKVAVMVVVLLVLY